MNNFIQRFITALFLVAGFVALFILVPPIYFSAALIIILITMLLTEWPRFFSVKQPAFWLIMPLYPVAPFVMLIWLNQNPHYRMLVVVLFAAIALFDSGAYVCGKLFGRHAIAPTISPGKTWEGVVGGYGITCALMWGIFWLLSISVSIPQFIVWMALVCLLGLLGDLFESWLKRRAQIKDSGFILPGHGGLFDRFDGIMGAVPLFFFLRDLLISYF